MRQLLNLVTPILTFFLSCHQPEITFQKTIGGDDEDQLLAIRITADSNYLLAGWSNSRVSGEKTVENEGVIYADYWVLKYDKNWNKIWEKCIGGTNIEGLRSMDITKDGGCVLSGESSSDISGEKTENCKGGSDIWVVKLDKSGNVEWNRTIGGNGHDAAAMVRQAPDGGYIAGGCSNSNISGDKKENCRGDFDMWVIKLNNRGEVQWTKTMGGDKWEFCNGIEFTKDSGFLFCGNSGSSISGERTEPNRGAMADYWIVKLDKNGQFAWDKTYGGSEDEMASTITACDNGYIITGFSISPKSGDKSDNCKGKNDWWVIRTDTAGKILWDKTIGGTKEDVPIWNYRTVLMDDGGFVIAGMSKSGVSGDKTDSCRGDSDYWIVRLDKKGNIIWDKTIGGDGFEELHSFDKIDEHHFLLGGFSSSGISGDKKEASRGGRDMWIVEIKD